MMEITLPIVLQILQTLGILVGIIYYLSIMRSNQRTNKLYTARALFKVGGPDEI